MESLPNLISHSPVLVQNLIALLILLAMIGLPLPKFIRLFWRKPMWEGRENWVAQCLPPEPGEKYKDSDRLIPKMAFDKQFGYSWSQMREMRIGDYYELRFGKRRRVKSIRFIDNGEGYPEEYKLTVDMFGNQQWQDGEILKGPISHEFVKPKKIAGIRIEVTVPKNKPIGERGSPAWSIYNIYITESRLFGIWKAVIGGEK